MDQLIRKVSMRVAQASSRRDFLSRTIRLAAGWGLGLAAILPGGRAAWADSSCSWYSEGNCASGFWTSTMADCSGTGTPGCKISGAFRSRCSSCKANDQYGNICNDSSAYNTADGCWYCCCSGSLYECMDCVDLNTGDSCLCDYHIGGSC